MNKLPYCESLRTAKDHQQGNPISIREQVLRKTALFLMINLEFYTSRKFNLYSVHIKKKGKKRKREGSGYFFEIIS